MYGYEATGGLGGIAARAGSNPYLARNLAIRDPGAMVVGNAQSRSSSGLTAPGYLLGNTPGGGPPQVSWGGGAVEQSPAHQLTTWRQVLDFHNSPAPWILMALLFLYGYVHVSYRRGRAAIGGGVA